MDGHNETAPVDPGAIPQARRPVEEAPQGSAVRVPEPRGVVDADRGRVLARYARLMRSGRPEVCRPPRREQLDPRRGGAGNDGKVIYPDRGAAEAAARELEALGGRPQRSYLCARSRHGHFHLTTDQTVGAAGGRVLREMIPTQRTR